MEDAETMDVEDVVAWEKRLEASGTSLAVLMERAGAAVANAVLDAVVHLFGPNRDKRNVAPDEACDDFGVPKVLILAGNGNNGGDGWAAARLLCEAEAPLGIVIAAAKKPEGMTEHPAKEEAFASWDVVGNSPNAKVVVNPEDQELEELLEDADIIVDAILGTGFSGSEVRPPFDRWIGALNAANGKACLKCVISADCPSGLNAQTAEAAHTTVRADITITMLAQKTGIAKQEAKPYTGDVKVAHIDALR